MTMLGVILAAIAIAIGIVASDRIWAWLTRREGPPYVVASSSMATLEADPLVGPAIAKARREGAADFSWIEPNEVELRTAQDYRLVYIPGWRRRRIEHHQPGRPDDRYHLMLKPV